MINPRARRIEWLAWVGVLLVTATLLLAFLLANLKMRARLARPLPVYGQVADFTLTNLNGRAISLADLRGQVWVADVIFTRCTGLCLQMTRQMKELQQALHAASSAKLVSLTTDPDFDTPPVLKIYAERFQADTNRWMFLTGPKPDLARLAVGSLKLAASENKPDERQSPEDLFTHASLFVVVDQRGRLRGWFETVGQDVNPQKVKGDILAAVRRLERER